MKSDIENQSWLDSVFPASRTNDFFDALFGGAEEGAYDIRLVCRENGEDRLSMAFELLQRPGKCLRCNLTYGLPEVFKRHPVLNVAGVAEELARKAGWEHMTWELGHTEEESPECHRIPFTVFRA
ncbi:MAG: hypothetical protein K5657_08335 [Desulfovibrio sp.]|nr:hypothetical protein [Desulfovibrio sp.]